MDVHKVKNDKKSKTFFIIKEFRSENSLMVVLKIEL